MARSVSGGCLCGGLRYQYDGEIGLAGYCHCSDCRKMTGSAFGVSLRFARDRFRVLGGNVKGFAKAVESGNTVTRHFCADCGSPIFTSSPAHADAVYVEAGSLDDPEVVRPTHQSWTGSTVPWANIDPSLPAYAKGRK